MASNVNRSKFQKEHWWPRLSSVPPKSFTELPSRPLNQVHPRLPIHREYKSPFAKRELPNEKHHGELQHERWSPSTDSGRSSKELSENLENLTDEVELDGPSP